MVNQITQSNAEVAATIIKCCKVDVDKAIDFINVMKNTDTGLTIMICPDFHFDIIVREQDDDIEYIYIDKNYFPDDEDSCEINIDINEVRVLEFNISMDDFFNPYFVIQVEGPGFSLKSIPSKFSEFTFEGVLNALDAKFGKDYRWTLSVNETVRRA